MKNWIKKIESQTEFALYFLKESLKCASLCRCNPSCCPFSVSTLDLGNRLRGDGGGCDCVDASCWVVAKNSSNFPSDACEMRLWIHVCVSGILKNVKKRSS